MTETLPIVLEVASKGEAYQIGFDTFRRTRPGPAGRLSLSNFTQLDVYTDEIAPDLRSLAGYGDNGPGTYQEDRKIGLIQQGDESDNPTEAELLQASVFFDTVKEEFNRGAKMALDHAYGGDDD